jgi:hypothetical protein
VWPEQISLSAQTEFKIMKIAKQVNLYPAKSEISYLRKHLENIGFERKASQNIYITRTGNLNGRHIENEKELLNILESYDFICVNPDQMSFKEQLNLFATAKIVVAPHGAALSHLVNFPANAKILELNSDRDVRWHIRKMCRDLNLHHELLLGLKSDAGSFNVNLKLVEEFVQNNSLVT